MSTDYIWYTRGGDKRVTERCALLLYLRTTVRHQRAMVDLSVANEKQIIIILFFELIIFHFFTSVTGVTGRLKKHIQPSTRKTYLGVKKNRIKCNSRRCTTRARQHDDACIYHRTFFLYRRLTRQRSHTSDTSDRSDRLRSRSSTS